MGNGVCMDASLCCSMWGHCGLGYTWCRCVLLLLPVLDALDCILALLLLLPDLPGYAAQP